MNKKIREKSRNIHRDLAYLFLGLIISFSISGIALNHRRDFSPREYVYSSEAVEFKFKSPKLNEDDIKSLLKEHNIKEEYRTFRLQGENIRIFLEDALVEVNKNTGKGTLERTRQRPVLGQMTILHQTTNNWWIWYSDIFGVAMLTIAITGTFISGGKFSFTNRGWKLTIAGVLFPLVFLLFIY